MSEKDLLRQILAELGDILTELRKMGVQNQLCIDRQEILYTAHENQCELRRRVDDTIIKFRKEKEDE